ncbi:uracil-DNA glycosylase, putative [Babesia caballi]|uniref:Uracil-DNA glycosylase, putative n=1 Tax=Babesia caballi TaxID=5871 RepID=A0AAV4LZV6_BABCB|nr:uracil-DNA glycosylase, putative [Babesia caballi]
MKDHSHTRFDPDAFFKFEEDELNGHLTTRQNSLSPTHTESFSDDAETVARLDVGYADVDSDASQNENDAEEEFDEKLIRRKSALLDAIGKFKANNPEKMTLQEYMMHSYVILHTKNEHTILTYEIIAAHSKIGPEAYAETMRAQTLSRLEQENLYGDVIGILTSDMGTDQEKAELDKHFTWLCQCCCAAMEEKDEMSGTESLKRQRHDAVEPELEQPQSHRELGMYAYEQVNAPCNFSELLSVPELPNDVMYEALRQNGNRLVQRSLYGRSKRQHRTHALAANPRVTNTVASAAELKGFAEDIQK